MVKVDVLLTASKILAYIILTIGTIYSFIFHDASILITAFSCSAGLMGVKTFTAGYMANIKDSNTDNEISDATDKPDIG